MPPPCPPSRIFIVEDKEFLRELLADMIETWSDFTACGMAASAEEALTRIPEADPHVALVDINLGQGPSGIDLIQELRATHPHICCVVLTGYDAKLFCRRAYEAGAAGYVHKYHLDYLEPFLRRSLSSR